MNVRYFRGSLAFAISGLIIITLVMAFEVYVRGYTYKNTPPLGNLIFGVIIFMPYLLAASIGFAVGLHLFRVTPRLAQSMCIGAVFPISVGLAYWAFGLKPFNHSMIAHGALIFGLAVPAPLLVKVLAPPRPKQPSNTSTSK